MITTNVFKSASHRRRDTWLLIAIVSLLLVAFFADWKLPLGIAGGVLFVVPVALTLLFKQPVYTWIVSGVSIVLIILDIFVKPASGVPFYFVIINRSYAFVAIGIVVGIGYLQRQLVRQSERLASLSVVEERERLSRELHDDLSQLLGSLGARASAVSELLLQRRVDEAQREMKELREGVGQAYLDVRHYITGLRVHPWGDQRFFLALKDFVTHFAADAGLQLSLDIPDASFRFAPNVEIQAIRIVQEALNNTLRHANARNVSVRADLHDSKVRITIQDNGQGFDISSIDRNNHLGLQMMRERAELAGGSLDVVSAPGNGTSVTVELPCVIGKNDGD